MNKRKPHAILETSSRVVKARKIELILASHISVQNCKILEIGCGSGVISNYFSKLGNDVHAVDVIDQRTIKEGYAYTQVSGVILPFDDNTFDIVITNHVIEHVGESDNQNLHLDEIKRVLKPNGVGYLAVPNKWSLFESHYKLPLLSWLPRRIADFIVSLLKKNTYYDCYPLSIKELKMMLNLKSLEFENNTLKSLKLMISIESNNFLMQSASLLPDSILRLFLPIVPTISIIFKAKTKPN